MKPGKRGIIFAGTGIPLSMAGIFLTDNLGHAGFLYLAFCLFLLAFDALRTVRPGQADLQYRVPAAGFVGGESPFECALQIDGLRRPIDVTMQIDLVGDAAPLPQIVVTVDGQQPTFTKSSLVPLRRGILRFNSIWLAWNSPMGFWQQIKQVPIDQEVAAIPNIPAVHQEAIKFFSRDSFFGSKHQQETGSGSEFSALREYVHGLDHRSIDWKQSARHRQLVCKEFETERNHQIILAYDTGHLMSSPVDGIPRLDHAINAGLLMSYVSLRHGDRVGVYSFDSAAHMFAEPVSGTTGFQTLQHRSSDLSYTAEETNYTLGLAELTGKITRRSLIIIMTDFVDTTMAELMMDSVERLSKKHMILFVCIQDSTLTHLYETRPDVMEDIANSVIVHDILKERRLVFERLKRLGVHCIDAPANQLGTAVVNNYLHIKHRELI